ncbi:MAG: WhiB family transcriptional regulator [Acidimicrobiales bacterium]
MTMMALLEWDDSQWRDKAACRASDPELFFPVGSTGTAALGEIRAAKALCAMCGVRDECLQFALEANQEAGVWGGTSEEERRRLRRAWLAGRRRALVTG